MSQFDDAVVELPGRDSAVRLPRRSPIETLGGASGVPAGRLSDKAQCPADAHGCPGCPHPTVGPSVQGSPNVHINNLPALRVSDSGMHAACCGPNRWTATGGTPRVLINRLPAHRMNDQTSHCGGTGKLIEGSPNVMFGGVSQSGPGLQGAVQQALQQRKPFRR